MLTQILAFLPPADLLTARHVNKHWDRLIETAPCLKLRQFSRQEEQSIGDTIIPENYSLASSIEVELDDVDFGPNIFGTGEWDTLSALALVKLSTTR